MKKILITGVYSSGKTSLIALLEQRLNTLNIESKVFSEVSRECPFPLNCNQTLESSCWLISKQVENELNTYLNMDFLIFDRGLLDIFAHTKDFLSESGNQSNIFFLNIFEELLKLSLTRFDYIFHAQSSDKYEIYDDGVRNLDKSYQIKLEEIHVDYLTKHSIEHVVLCEDNNSRVSQILEVIL